MPFQQHDGDKHTPEETETLYTLKEAARMLHVSEQALRQAIEEGIFRGVEKNGKDLLPETELDRARQLLEQNHLAQTVEEMVEPEPEEASFTKVDTTQREKEAQDIHEIIPLDPQEGRKDTSDWNQKWRAAFERITEQIRKIRIKKPLSRTRVNEWVEGFFRLIESKKKKEVQEEFEKREVSLKLGFITGKNEMFCDFCEVNDHFYPGAIFADIYVDGALKWMMCPNCLNYCRQQANGSMEHNVRARFNQLAHRLEREARRARQLAAAEDFRVPHPHEWEAWETASLAMQEVATSHYPIDGFGEENSDSDSDEMVDETEQEGPSK
ncbi:helix-turn-helix domain-containing protein [Salinithrix halophila]|uniref:Helix-turn-helix domain-containing protein n=1 Tax=Salinithrix halophila TaxID=1485204 RepID=A0ABV8JID0_9BACL